MRIRFLVDYALTAILGHGGIKGKRLDEGSVLGSHPVELEVPDPSTAAWQ
jgi:hypothetical protein